MADKEELINQATSSAVSVEKVDGNLSSKNNPDSGIPSTSTTIQSEAVAEIDKTDLDTKSKDANAKEKSSEEENRQTTPPSLYQKFVSSFDSVLQNLVSEEGTKRPILSTLDIDGIAAYIKEEQPRNVIFMVGAGISTSAGIPDFRSPKTGLYNNLKKFNLPDPQAVFDITFFKQNPEPFYVLARDLFHEDIKPTLTHYLIRLFEEKGMLRRCFTQNIDALEYAAGVSDDRIITAHGSHQSATCQKSSCKKKYNKEWLLDRLRDKEKIVARCETCDSVVKPDIVFFGEKLSNRFFSTALADFPKCDLLIIMGTSLVVQPFASLVQQVPKETPRLLVNLVPVGKDDGGTFFNEGESGPLKYGETDNRQDVFWKGKCDDGSLKLARILGWEDELKAMAKKSKAL